MPRRKKNAARYEVEEVGPHRWRVRVFLGDEQLGEGFRFSKERAEQIGQMWVNQNS